MPAWRPLLFATKEILDNKIEEYFKVTPQEDWTMTGLAVFLDTSRETLCNYKEREEFFDSIKKALDKVEMWYELDLKHKWNTGTIFALKNLNWKDKQEIEWDMKNTNMDVTDWTTLEQKKLIAQLFIKNNGQKNTDWDVKG